MIITKQQLKELIKEAVITKDKSDALSKRKKEIETELNKLFEEGYDFIKEEKPSAGLTKKEKSSVVKKAKAGKDIGKKGKGFKAVAAKAAKEYGSAEKGKAVAAAAMWKNIKR